MDRRDALKRLAAGGATIATASLIVSQPAFAFTAPTVTGSPTITVTTNTRRRATISIGSVPAGTCPASAITTPTPTQQSLTWTTFWPDGNTTMSSGSGATVTIPGSFVEWFPNDRIRITVVYRYECQYTGSTTDACFQWFRELAASGGGNSAVWTQSAASGPTGVSCGPSPLAFSAFGGGGIVGRTADGQPIS